MQRPNIPNSFAILFLQHRTLLSPQTSTTHCLFRFVPVLHSSLIVHWTPSNLRGSSSEIIYFCLFIVFMGFLWQEYWSGLPFPPPVDHNLSELFSMSHPSSHSLAHSFIELCTVMHNCASYATFVMTRL